MPKKQIKSLGTNFEYKVMHVLESFNWLVFRSAGSHSCSDLIAVKDGTALFVQCKYSFTPVLSKSEKDGLAYISSMSPDFRSYAVCRGGDPYGLKIYQVKYVRNEPKDKMEVVMQPTTIDRMITP